MFETKVLILYLVSAYAPVGVSEAQTWDEFIQNLVNCINEKQPNDVLIIGSDTNSSLGINYENRTGVAMSSVGKFGLPHHNNAGTRFSTFLEINSLVACSTFFQKKNYTTWRHPRSKLPYQIDHIITQKADFCRVVDVFVSKPLLDSDHLAVQMKLRIVNCLHKKYPKKPTLKRNCKQLLVNQETCQIFNTTIAEKICNSPNASYELLEKSMHDAASSVLPEPTRVCPDWFSANKTELLKLIEKRNVSVCNKMKRITRRSTENARKSRNELKTAISRAKSTWINNLCNKVNISNALNRGTKTFWDSIKLLKRGIQKPPPQKQTIMQKEDGSKCVSSEANAEVFRHHFEKLYNREPVFDASVLETLPRLPPMQSMCTVPDDEEIRKSILRLKNNAPGASGLTAPMFKSLAQDAQCFEYLRNIIVDIWVNESYPAQWDTGRLVILPKKGDLSRPGNYRGIMLLETAYKILAIIMHNRLQPLVGQLDHEAQCGFRQGRGCTDAVFSIKLALKKRKEHNLETWVLFLNVVKAFDRVPHQLPWQVLEQFGLLDKIISILKLLHKNFNVNFEVDSVNHTMACIIGVKQCDVLGPVLFVIYIAAIMITWRKTHIRPLCLYRTKEDFVLTGRRFETKG